MSHTFRDSTERVIGAAVAVHRALGPGYLEGIYERAMESECIARSIGVERQVRVDVRYRGEVVGVHCLDMVIDRAIIIELKAVSTVNEAHLAQLRSYLRATDMRIGLLLNFGCPVLGIRRVVN